MPDVTKPLPESMLTYYQQDAGTFNWQQFHKTAEPPITKISLKIIHLKFYSDLPSTNELNTDISTLCFPSYIVMYLSDCPACRTTLVATRFRVAVICPIIQVPHCIRVFFYFVWFVFINHIFQFYYELCTYCDILDIYLS